MALIQFVFVSVSVTMFYATKVGFTALFYYAEFHEMRHIMLMNYSWRVHDHFSSLNGLLYWKTKKKKRL